MSVAERFEQEIAQQWGALRGRYDEWPVRITRVRQDLEIWLRGEEVIHIQLEHRVEEGQHGFVEDAVEFSVFILTTQFAVLIVIPREDRANFGQHQRFQVLRESLSGLESDYPSINRPFEGLTFTLTYDQFPRPVVIKLSNSSIERPVLEDELEFFTELRDDLFSSGL